MSEAKKYWAVVEVVETTTRHYLIKTNEMQLTSEGKVREAAELAVNGLTNNAAFSIEQLDAETHVASKVKSFNHSKENS